MLLKLDDNRISITQKTIMIDEFNFLRRRNRLDEMASEKKSILIRRALDGYRKARHQLVVYGSFSLLLLVINLLSAISPTIDLEVAHDIVQKYRFLLSQLVYFLPYTYIVQRGIEIFGIFYGSYSLYQMSARTIAWYGELERSRRTPSAAYREHFPYDDLELEEKILNAQRHTAVSRRIVARMSLLYVIISVIVIFILMVCRIAVAL